MTGRLADLFRLAWGLLYWNSRKTWFQLRPGRTRCPCQSPSDSGRAFETGCDACIHWHRPAQFRRVCPLLVETAAGLRCSVDTRDVRPFWTRAVGYYAAGAASLYLVGALGIFVFLRTVGYPVSIVHLVWPGSWHHVGEARGWFFLDRSQRAFAANRPAEGMLYLANAYQFDPGNYAIGFALAQKLQLNQPQRADEIYRQLLRNHPDRYDATTRAWFRALLARGDFPTLQELARTRVVDDKEYASVWMRALIFATRETNDEAPLRQLLESPRAAAWQPLLETELLLRHGRIADARTALNRSWTGAPPYAFFYQVSELTALGDGLAAVDLLEKNPTALDDTARVTLLLQAYASLEAVQARQRLITTLLEPPLKLAVVNLVAADLIRHPDAKLFGELYAKFTQAAMPLNDTSLETYIALYCAAGVVGDWTALQAIATTLQREPNGNSRTLGLAESFFRGQTTQTRIAGLLIALPAPLEVHYALLEHYPGPSRLTVAGTR